MTDFSTHVKNTSKGFTVHCLHGLLRARRIVRRMCECDRMGWPGGPPTRTARLGPARHAVAVPVVRRLRPEIDKARHARRGKQAGENRVCRPVL
jgi:hypothetical protein